jgi:diphosphomevalonate decarboxylase
MTQAKLGRARACANIALAKYWGKSDVALNLPAVPSISLTLSPLFTETSVELSPALAHDELLLNGSPALGGELARACELLDRVRAEAGVTLHARIETQNHFPTASGLASSASGFCALAAAARRAAGLAFDPTRISALARRSSASAARSAFAGFAELPAGLPGDDSLAAHAIAPAAHWNVRIVVAVTAEGRKAVGSTDGMTHTKTSSPYYEPWVRAAPALADQVRRGVLERDLARLGPAMEQSTLAFHACALAADPGLLYFQPATLAAFACVRELRASKRAEVYATMDAGPHVKALCHAEQVSTVKEALEATPGVLRTIVAEPGPGVELL